MPHSDAFALKKLGLNEFLFSEVGTELNGSKLTMLSVLARLGQDPWTEAAKWTRLPKATIIDRLASSISQMPLSPQALNEARATAARLFLLLPSQNASPPEVRGAASGILKAWPNWLPFALLAALAIAGGLSMGWLGSSPDAAALSVQPLVNTPQAPTN